MSFEKSVLVIYRQDGKFSTFLFLDGDMAEADIEGWAAYHAKGHGSKNDVEICDDPLVREICAAWEKEQNKLRECIAKLEAVTG